MRRIEEVKRLVCSDLSGTELSGAGGILLHITASPQLRNEDMGSICEFVFGHIDVDSDTYFDFPWIWIQNLEAE